MDNDVISQILVTVLSVMIFILLVLVAIFVALKAKEKQKNKKIDKKSEKNQKKSKTSENTKPTSNYTKESIMNFMEFEKIEDNMIVQKNGRRYLMVVECQGINYDLMSGMEKVAVEEGFQQFLNTLRHPIQIYIQTRTVNLEKSINAYKDKIKEIEDQYNQRLFTYNQLKSNYTATQQEIDREFFELTKQKNLLEYGIDLVNNTERMSLNKNILNRKYYIVIPYFAEEVADKEYDYEEIRSMAFSELYTKSQSIIRTLSSCSVAGKILSSKELVELLYVAYNRDESEIYGIERATKAGYDELYSTAPDVFEKKMKVLDKYIEEQAINVANRAIEKVKSKAQREAEKKENNLDELVDKMAELIISENRRYVGEKVAQEAIKEIKEGGENTDEEDKKTRRGRKPKSVQ